jgi:two-component system, cell cycle response regulator DivK
MMPTILIVDDRRDAIEILRAKLQQKGFVTESTVDAREIAGICERQQIDAIIMDMNMPELDGCEATELLKAKEATSKIPVIMCTAQTLDGDKERAVQAGCDGFIEKPIHVATLMSVLGQFFEVDKDEHVDETEKDVAETEKTGEGGLGKSETGITSPPLDASKLAAIISTPHPGVAQPNLIADRPVAAEYEKKDQGLLPSPAE